MSPWRAVQEWEMIPLAVHGADAGPLGFEIITAVAINRDGTLAVADIRTCSITLIDRPSGRFKSQWGGCGGGPGEFEQLTVISFLGDTLLAYDRGRNIVIMLDGGGTEVSRIAPEFPPGTWIGAMHGLDSGLVLVALERVRITPEDTADLSLAAILDLRSGKVTRWLAPEVGRARQGAQNVLRRKTVCVRPEAPSQIAILNDWAFEGIGVELGAQARMFHFLTATPLLPSQAGAGQWSPGAIAGVVCGENGIFFKHTRGGARPPDGSPPIGSQSFLEMRGYDGSLLMRTSVTSDTSLIHGRLGAARGDTVFAFSNLLRDYPVVGEFLLAPRRP
ncbi:MAG TPA: hypothetical protein VMK53_00440 [Gemmatimonadales bacterium]|nr:hypothetical protein [Gemmatimonadales bacterium]